MKSKSLILSAMLIAMPSVLMAQQNIQKAFDALLKQKQVIKVTAHHDMEKDPETGVKKGQADVYDFTLPAGNPWRQLVLDIEDAIHKDSENAYSVSSSENNKGVNYVTLVVGDGSSESVAIGKIPGSKYMYACFLDKKDPAKQYRYAYAVEWAEGEDGIKGRIATTYGTTQKYRYAYAVEWAEGQEGIKGRIATTYGTTQKYREQSDNGKKRIKSSTITINRNPLSKDKMFEMIGNNAQRFTIKLDAVDTLATNSQEWLSQFSTARTMYGKYLAEHNPTLTNVFANNIYNLCKKADVLDADEKKIVISEISRLRDATADEYSKSLLVLRIKKLQ